jgi:hypothetical protein
MVTDVHLTVAKPWADVGFAGQLDEDGIALLTQVVQTARLMGCRRITLHVDGADESDERLTWVVSELRGWCEAGGASLEIVGGEIGERLGSPA